MLDTYMLFVCTGNTCRSPMAQAIAQAIIGQLNASKKTITVDSAGVAAGEGHPASQEAVDTLQERNIDLNRHQSKLLTTELVERAHVIYTMTPAHAQAIIQAVPGSADKVFPLDSAHPIMDPIGQSIEVYRDVADQLERLIKVRLEEIIT